MAIANSGFKGIPAYWITGVFHILQRLLYHKTGINPKTTGSGVLKFVSN
jgi:hypothetical protein